MYYFGKSEENMDLSRIYLAVKEDAPSERILSHCAVYDVVSF